PGDAGSRPRPCQGVRPHPTLCCDARPGRLAGDVFSSCALDSSPQPAHRTSPSTRFALTAEPRPLPVVTEGAVDEVVNHPAALFIVPPQFQTLLGGKSEGAAASLAHDLVRHLRISSRAAPTRRSRACQRGGPGESGELAFWAAIAGPLSLSGGREPGSLAGPR